MDLDFESGYVNISNAPTLSKPRSVTFDEGVSLILGLELLRSSISSDRADLLEKVDSLAVRLSSIFNLPSVFSVTTNVNQKISEAIAKALSSQSGLEIQYHSLYRDEITQRRIFPIEVLDVDGVQYLSAYCHEASDFRQFKIERIQSATVIQIEKRVTHSVTQNQSISSVIAVLKPSRELAERFNLTDPTVGSELRYETYSQQWLERSVLAAGGAAALVSPPEIRASIAQLAQSMLDRYKGE
jgi:proteasome accessory factor C